MATMEALLTNPSLYNKTQQRSYLPVNDLKQLPTNEELIDYIETDPYKIKYPNRGAKFLRNSFQLSFLDHFTTETLNVQQENVLNTK